MTITSYDNPTMEESLQTVAAVIEVPSFDRVGIAHFIWRKLIVLIQGLITGVGRACFAELFFILIYIKRTFAEPPYHTDPGKSRTHIPSRRSSLRPGISS